MAPDCAVPVLAWLVDRVAGDPPNTWHPVAWQGRLLAWAEEVAPTSEAGRYLWGWAVLAGGAGASLAAGAAIERLARRLPGPAGLGLAALALKMALSARGLDRAAGEVEEALRCDDLHEARRLLAWHLVSRPTGELSAEEVAAATVESLAENLTDALVGPLLAWCAGGLGATWGYRFVQTADSMWGYHDAAHEWLGKPAARVDDALNWLPARLAAGLLALASALAGADAARGVAVRGGQARRTASPNAGQTMATMAGALHVTLIKRDHYALEGGREPVTPDVLARARRIVRLAGGLAIVAAALVSWRSGRRKEG